MKLLNNIILVSWGMIFGGHLSRLAMGGDKVDTAWCLIALAFIVLKVRELSK